MYLCFQDAQVLRADSSICSIYVKHSHARTQWQTCTGQYILLLYTSVCVYIYTHTRY